MANPARRRLAVVTGASGARDGRVPRIARRVRASPVRRLRFCPLDDGPRGAPWIDPADVAPVVAFLASDEARMVSGAAYEVTAGDSAHFTA